MKTTPTSSPRHQRALAVVVACVLVAVAAIGSIAATPAPAAAADATKPDPIYMPVFDHYTYAPNYELPAPDGSCVETYPGRCAVKSLSVEWNPQGRLVGYGWWHHNYWARSAGGRIVAVTDCWHTVAEGPGNCVPAHSNPPYVWAGHTDDPVIAYYEGTWDWTETLTPGLERTAVTVPQCVAFCPDGSGTPSDYPVSEGYLEITSTGAATSTGSMGNYSLQARTVLQCLANGVRQTAPCGVDAWTAFWTTTPNTGLLGAIYATHGSYGPVLKSATLTDFRLTPPPGATEGTSVTGNSFWRPSKLTTPQPFAITTGTNGINNPTTPYLTQPLRFYQPTEAGQAYTVTGTARVTAEVYNWIWSSCAAATNPVGLFGSTWCNGDGLTVNHEPPTVLTFDAPVRCMAPLSDSDVPHSCKFDVVGPVVNR